MSFDLNKRHQQILWATIRQYISTAEPVGSKTLVDGYNLNISPATIRSGFATLEKAGFLYQPHTSAGRIPSDSGYRLYVDRLIQPSPAIGHQLEGLLADKLDWDRSLEAILRGAVEVLATLSGYITMITLPQPRRSTVKHVQLIRVESAKIMSIVVWDTYETQSILMQLPPDCDLESDRDLFDRELQILSNFLNSKLSGRSVLEISKLDWSELELQFHQYVNLINNLLTDLARQAKPTQASQMMIWGISEVLDQPEFSQLQQVKALMHLLESEQDKVSSSIFDPHLDPASDPQSQIAIRIGTENPLKPMQACTLISANYHQDSIPVGSVGLLGPTRMLYEDSIALVKSAAAYITAAIDPDRSRS
jgi:heat-inducible transcriptional repressor